jgi:MraZ protein
MWGIGGYCGAWWWKGEGPWPTRDGVEWHGVAQFYGRYEHSLDQKGRVTLPARYREAFADGVFVGQYRERCLALWPPEEFEKQLADIAAVQDRSTADRNRARVFLAGISQQELDRQGRVAIPRSLLEFARLDGTVLLTGALDHLEIWNPSEWETRIAPYVAGVVDPESAPA